jgi:dienelactone hydrolase
MTSHWTRRQWLSLFPAAATLIAQERDGFRAWTGREDIQPGATVLHGHAQYTQADSMLSSHLRALNRAFEGERERIVTSLKTPAAMEEYQTATRRLLQETLGALPQRTPLNAKVTGRLERADYIVEKVIFESRPQFYVTANVYLPRKAAPPFPGVVASVGHWGAGKAFEDYQRISRYLAQRGILVLVYDLPGMGERVESWNPVFQRPLIHPGTSQYFVTTEHGFAAGRAILTGSNLVRFLLWEAVRATDYLTERKDVDAQRVAATGVSGGGWLTELLAAFDPRIKVAIPVCYGGCIADNLFRSKIGILDVEALIAPRPLLLIEATGDSRASVAEKFRRRNVAGAVYRAAGAEERTRFMIAEGPHGYVPSMYPVIYEWLQRWLPIASSVPEPPADRPLALEPEAALACTVTGQVLTSLGGETLTSLIRAEARRLAEKHVTPRNREELGTWRTRLRGRITDRLTLPGTRSDLRSEVLGRDETGSYSLERLVYFSEPDVFIPALLLLPRKNAPAGAVIMVNGEGKSASGIIESYLAPLAGRGYAVLSIDPRGIGETAPARRPDYADFTVGDEAGHAYSAMRADRVLAGMRTYDVLRGIDYLASRSGLSRLPVSLIGQGTGGLLVLFAAALDERVRSAIAVSGLLSYSAITESEIYTHHLSSMVTGALQDFDLPDVAALIAPRRLALVNVVDASHRRAGETQAAAAYKRTATVYNLESAGSRFKVATADSRDEIFRLITEHV